MGTREERFAKYAAINYALSQMREENPKFDEEAEKYYRLTDLSRSINERLGGEFIYRACALAKDRYFVGKRYSGATISAGVYNFPYKGSEYEESWIYKDFISLKDFCTFAGAWMKLVFKEKDSDLANETANTLARAAFHLDDYFGYTMAIGNLSKFLEMLGMPTEYLLNMTDTSPYGQLRIANMINLLNIATSKIITAIEGISDEKASSMIQRVTDIYNLTVRVQPEDAKVKLDYTYPNESYCVSSIEQSFKNKQNALSRKANNRETITKWSVGILSGLGIGSVTLIGLLTVLPGFAVILGIGAGIIGGCLIGNKSGEHAYDKLYYPELKKLEEVKCRDTQKEVDQFKVILSEASLALNEKNLQEIREKIPQMVYLLQMQIETANEIIVNDLPDIPAKYVRDKEAIETFIEYFDDKRVDTIKEAVNLYVSERKQEQYQEALMKQERERVLAEQKTAHMAEKMAFAEQEKAAMMGRIAKEQEENNRKIKEMQQKQLDLAKEKNEHLDNIQNTLSDIKSKLE